MGSATWILHFDSICFRAILLVKLSVFKSGLIEPSFLALPLLETQTILLTVASICLLYTRPKPS